MWTCEIEPTALLRMHMPQPQPDTVPQPGPDVIPEPESDTGTDIPPEIIPPPAEEQSPVGDPRP